MLRGWICTDGLPPLRTLYIAASLFALFRATNPSTTPGGMRQGDVMDPWVASIVTERVEGDHRFENLLEYLKATNYSFGNMPTSAEGNPLVVWISVYVNRLVDLNEESMVYTCDIYLRQIWHDHGFDFRHILGEGEVLVVPDPYLDLIWKPDTFIQNSRMEHVHTVTQPNRALFVYANGTMFYSNRLTMTVWCNVFLQDFPMDRQRCELRLMTYRYTTSRLRLGWLQPWATNSSEDVALEVNDLPMAMFTLARQSTEDCTSTFITGTFSCVMAVFEFQREYGYYITQIYIPSTLIVFMSWVTFWLSPDCAPARISLGITTLLTMASQVGSAAGAALPKVSYVKYIDIWVTGCMTFLVTAITEYAIVYNLWWRPVEQLHRKGAEERKSLYVNNHTSSRTNQISAMENNVSGDSEAGSRPPRFNSVLIDKICRLLFPGMFAVFNLLYWYYPAVTSRGPRWEEIFDNDVL